MTLCLLTANMSSSVLVTTSRVSLAHLIVEPGKGQEPQAFWIIHIACLIPMEADGIKDVVIQHKLELDVLDNQLRNAKCLQHNTISAVVGSMLKQR